MTALAEDPLAVSPMTKVLAGGDVAGINRLASGSWSPSNRGIGDQQQTHIASITYKRTNTGTQHVVFAGYGNGTVGGIESSIDGGVNWSVLDTSVVFNGLAVGDDGPFDADPSDVRSSGNLIVIDEDNSLMYVGTYNDGVFISDDGGDTWSYVALGADTECSADPAPNPRCYIRTLVTDPIDPTTLYAGTYGDGAFKIEDANAVPTVTALSSPDHAEEFAFQSVSPYALYCACGVSGMYWASRSSGYGTWTAVNSGIETGTDRPEWSAVAYSASTGDLYAGAVNPDPVDPETGLYNALKRRASGTSTWIDVLDDDPLNVHDAVGGFAGRPWWLADSATGSPDYLLGGPFYDAAMIIADGSKVMVAGRSGVWYSPNSGGDWFPHVATMGSTVNKFAASSPDAGYAYVANVDWTFFWSDDYGDNANRRDVPPTANVKAAFAVATDPAIATDVYVAVGNELPDAQYNNHGEIYLNHDLPGQDTWVNMGLADAEASMCSGVGGSDMRPIGLAVGSDGSHTVIVAAVDGCGLWQYVSGTGWSQVKPPTQVLAYQGGTLQSPVVWPNPSQPYVYVLDRHAGALWRSNSYGASGSWTRIVHDLPDVDGNDIGFLAGDPGTTGRLWLTTGESDGTYRLENAHSGTLQKYQFTDAGDPVNPGPVAVKPGTHVVYIAGRVDPDHTLVDMWTSSNGGTSWSTVTTTDYQGTAVFPSNLAISDDDFAYIPTAGQGVVVHEPV
jgi:hypothetical protein